MLTYVFRFLLFIKLNNIGILYSFRRPFGAVMCATYTHNWALQTCSQDYGLTSHNTHVMCVNLIRGWRVSGQVYFTLKVFATNLLREDRRKKYFFFFGVS